MGRGNTWDRHIAATNWTATTCGRSPSATWSPHPMASLQLIHATHRTAPDNNAAATHAIATAHGIAASRRVAAPHGAATTHGVARAHDIMTCQIPIAIDAAAAAYRIAAMHAGVATHGIVATNVTATCHGVATSHQHPSSYQEAWPRASTQHLAHELDGELLALLQPVVPGMQSRRAALLREHLLESLAVYGLCDDHPCLCRVGPARQNVSGRKQAAAAERSQPRARPPA